MRHLNGHRFLIAGTLLGAAAIGTFALAENIRYPAAPERIQIVATPITSFDNRDPTRVRFGALEFRGGLELVSKASAFGGISALVMQGQERLVAVTDNGSWLSARLVYRDGRLDGIADADMAPLLGDNGKPLAAQGAYDSESAVNIGGDYYVGFERVHRIVRFAYDRDGFAARGSDVRVPADFKTLKNNASLECLATAPPGQRHAGKIIAITERSLDESGNHRSFVIDPANNDGAALRFSVVRSDDFDVTDCAYLEGGNVLILERRYSPARGVAMRIRKLELAAIKDGARVDGPKLIEADLGYQIDNMEGIAVTRNASGETILTLVSDDNFSAIQRNLILQFALVE